MLPGVPPPPPPRRCDRCQRGALTVDMDILDPIVHSEIMYRCMRYEAVFFRHAACLSFSFFLQLEGGEAEANLKVNVKFTMLSVWK